MKNIPAKIVAVTLLLIRLVPADAAVTTRTYATSQALSINGATCTELVQWSGGDPSATIVVESNGSPAKKHVGTWAYAPIVVEVSVPLSAALQNSLVGLCTNSATNQTLLLTDLDGKQLQANNAQLVEARFPALDAASKDSWHLTLVFRPESVQPIAGGTATPGGGGSRARASSSDFRVTLAGLPGNRISRVEPFTISRAAAADSVGAQRDLTAAFGATQIPDLSFTLSYPDAADWATWGNDFLVQGHSTDIQEKSGSIEILGPDLQTVLLPLQLSHVGFKRLARVPGPADSGIQRLRADLYCEAITLAASPAAAGTAPASTGATPAASEPPAATTPAPAPAPAPTGTTAAPDATAPAPAAGDTKTAGETKTPAKEPSTPAETVPVKGKPADSVAATKPATLSNPEDKGPRDPADFPRYAGTVRTAYRSNRSPSQIDEMADYSAAGSSAAVMEFFDKQLHGSGWTETSRYETEYGAKGGSKIISAWTKDKRKATVTIWDMAPDSVAIQSSVQQAL